LYNSVSYTPGDLNSVLDEVDNLISSKCCEEHSSCSLQHQTTVVEIISAVVLKYNKNDGETALSTNHIKHGRHRLYFLISILFTSMLRHGYVPDEMICSTIMPIQKNTRKYLNDSSNYRGIALNSPLCKLFEVVVLQKCKDTLQSTDMQFGYKKGVSTTDCTFVVNGIRKGFLPQIAHL
jgi:hypothetical protein